MATQAKVIIKGQHDIGSDVKSASKDLSSSKKTDQGSETNRKGKTENLEKSIEPEEDKQEG